MYEGLSALVVEPVMLLGRLGAPRAAHQRRGRRQLVPAPGTLMVSDHLNLTGLTPLLGPNAEVGPRFLDLTDA